MQNVATAPVAEKTETTQTAPVAVNTETITELQSKVKDLETKLSTVNFAELRLKAKADKTEKPTEGEAVTLASLKTRLDAAERKAVEAEDKARSKTAKSAYADALKAGGLQPLVASDVADSFIGKNLGKIRIGDDESVHYEESEGILKPLATIAADWLKSDHGKAYLPPKGSANSNGLNGTSNQNTKSGDDPQNVMSWNPKTQAEAMKDPTRYYALKQARPEFVKSLPMK